MKRLVALCALVVFVLALAPTAGAAGEEKDTFVQLLAINDFHGNLQPPSGSSGRIAVGPGGATVNAGGVEYLATWIKSLRTTNPNTITIGAGDLIGASPLISGLFHDEPTIESMNAIGLDVTGVGNHEFDEGIAELLRMQFGNQLGGNGCHPVDGCQDGTPSAARSSSTSLPMSSTSTPTTRSSRRTRSERSATRRSRSLASRWRAPR